MAEAAALGRGRPAFWLNLDFTKFWIGETISLAGVQVTAIALPLTAVTVLSAGPEALGVLRSAQFVPFLFFALLFGVWADRRRKRPLMMGANVTRALLIAVVPALAMLDALTVTVLYVLAFAIGTCTVLFDVCWMAYLPKLVSREHLVSANGKVTASFSAAELAGPGVGGLLVQAFGAVMALSANAASYVVSTLCLGAIRRAESAPEPPTAKRRIATDMAEGIILVVRDPYLRTIAVLGSSYNFWFLFLDALFVLYAIETLGFRPSVLGFVLAVSAIGGLLGAGLAHLITRRMPLGRAYVVFVVIGYVGPVSVPLAAAGSPSISAVLVVTGFFLLRFGVAISNVLSVSIRQAVTPPALLGRMTAGMRTLLFGLGTLGAVAGGLVAGQIGLLPAMWVAAVGSASATLPLFFSVIPRLRTLPTSPEPTARGTRRDEPAATREKSG